MLTRLKIYQDGYNSLSKQERSGYVKTLDEDVKVRAEVKALARHFLNLKMSNCGWCYIEAHARLLKLNIETMSKKTLEYALLVGTLLHDPINKNFDLILMPPRLTEELALYHLTFNPRAAKYFVSAPADVDKRIAAYLAKQSDEMKAKALPSALTALEKYPPAPEPETEREKEPDAKPKTTRGRRGATATNADIEAEPEPEVETEVKTDPETEQETPSEPAPEPETEQGEA